MTILASVGAACGCTSPDSSALFGLRPAPGDGVGSSGAGGEPESGGEEPSLASGGSPNSRGENAATGGLSSGVAGGGPTPDASTRELPPPNDPTDAGARDAVAPTPTFECEGRALQDACWYLSDDGQNCDAVCSTHGGFSDVTLTLLGTPAQGGSIESCAAILELLGANVSAIREGFRDDGLGLGCHIFFDANGAATEAWWLTSPALTSAASGIRVRRACGCAL